MIGGILNILKPPGLTSHDVVNKVRKIVNTKKVGHAGTLDPDAAGVLPVFIGPATRLLEYTSQAAKCYRVEILLGTATDTGDDSGNVIQRKEVPELSEAMLAKVLASFQGHLSQVPPMYSALKQEGQKLYELARRGKTVERPARSIFISEIKLLYFDKAKLILEVACSKGTYIRTLAEDIAKALQTVGTVTFLLRTQAGIFTLPEAAPLEEVGADYQKYLLPVDFSVLHLPKLALSERQALRFCQGVKTTWPGPELEILRVYNQAGRFLGIGKIDGEVLQPQKVFLEV